jgi:putative phosphoesterase
VGTLGAPVLTVGVVSDSHIPDRVGVLHPDLLNQLKAAAVDVILHAGDISGRGVLEELRQIAPVHAVRGNRDWAFYGELPLERRLELGGAKLLLLHAHGGFWRYLWDKWYYIRDGYRLERYLPVLERNSAPGDVVVFGHTHYPANEQWQGRLLFNPGSCSFGPPGGGLPSFGLLQIYAAGRVEGKICQLEGWRITSGAWKKLES